MNVPTRAAACALALLISPFVAGAACAQGAPEGRSAAAGKHPMQQIPHTLEALAAAKAGEYGRLRSEDKHRLEAADREIQALMRDNPDLNTLDEQERTRLFNAQETALAIVSRLKRSQLVCTYRQNIGTRLRTKHCVTRDMAEAEQRAAKEALHIVQKQACVPGEGNPCS